MEFLEFRVYEGINIYSFRPVVKLTLDLKEMEGQTTNHYGEFVVSLLKLIPSLEEHHCSLGCPGGFVLRLKEGTYFGHLLEHIILELQHLAGMNVIYGRTRKLAGQGIYEVVIEVESAEAGIQAAHSALEIIKSLLRKETVDLEKHVNLIREASIRTGLGPTTKAIAREALKRGIPVMRLGEGSILQLGYGCCQRRVEASITDSTGCIGVDIAGDKILTKQMLSEAGIPVPWGGIARTESEAVELAREIKGSVAVKPYDGNQGKGVALNLSREEQIIKACTIALNYSDRVIVEKNITGKQYRLLVVNGRMVAASERLPASVVGDGSSSIEELIRKVNDDESRGKHHEKPLTQISVDPVVLMVLGKQKLTLKSVPPAGKRVLLRENANLSTGGTAVDVTDQVHRENAEIAVRAANIIGLDVAGIDLVAEDISIPLNQCGGAVIEVNAAPGLRMHLHPSAGTPRNVAAPIVDMLFPEGVGSRIPIVAVTGTNGKTTTTRLIGHILATMGKVVGMTTSDGISVGGKMIIRGDATGPVSARTVLRDRSVEVAVLETARGGIIRAGLGFDQTDIGIITNISEDHLGIDGVEDLEDMAFVKSLIAETVGREGYVILNAGDLRVANMEKKCRGKVIYFSLEAENIIVRRHLGAGGIAVYVKKGSINVAKGNSATEIISIKDIPCTLSGLAVHNIENVLAATAGCLGLGIPIEIIREGLLNFNVDMKHNPGRLNLYEVGGINILVDYGHNLAGYKSVLATAKGLKPQKIIGVIGVPGDRQDTAITKVGEVAGQGCDYIIIKEDNDLRGRKAGEVAELLRKGVINSGRHKGSVEISLKETNAVLKALDMAEEGDLVVIFYEKLEPIITIISTFRELVKAKKTKKKALFSEATNKALI